MSSNPVHTRDRREVRSWAADLPEEFITCRDLGHLWRPFTARWVPQLNAYERTLRCGRCATERMQTVSSTGEILSGGYHYPQGYQAPAGAGRMGSEGRAELRLEGILRLLGGEDEGTIRRQR